MLLQTTRRSHLGGLFNGPSGWYTVTLTSGSVNVYVNQEYDGGGWVLVIANRINTNGMKNLTYSNAVNNCNYMATGGTLFTPNSSTALTGFNAFIGLKHWPYLAGRATAGKITVVQFVAATSGTTLNGTHTKRCRWQFNSFGSSYGMVGAASVGIEVGTTMAGMYSYHAVGGYNLTTYDVDQDVYGSNCSSLYNNTPWWYGACWSGSYFGGGGGGSYQDAAFWDSSGTDYHNYGAVYIK